jgi:hypothetical protein
LDWLKVDRLVKARYLGDLQRHDRTDHKRRSGQTAAGFAQIDEQQPPRPIVIGV